MSSPLKAAQSEISNAEEITLQFHDYLNWNLLYHDWPPRHREGEWVKEHKEEWEKIRKQIIDSITVRMQFHEEGLLGRVVEKSHMGLIASEIVYYPSFHSSPIHYTVISTKPQGKVRVAEKTKVVVEVPRWGYECRQPP